MAAAEVFRCSGKALKFSDGHELTKIAKVPAVSLTFWVRRGPRIRCRANADSRCIFLYERLAHCALLGRFILTLPLGATLGDLLDKPVAHGGFAFSRYSASGILAASYLPASCSFVKRPEAIPAEVRKLHELAANLARASSLISLLPRAHADWLRFCYRNSCISQVFHK